MLYSNTHTKIDFSLLTSQFVTLSSDFIAYLCVQTAQRGVLRIKERGKLDDQKFQSRF